jgi:hypothetical protein
MTSCRRPTEADFSRYRHGCDPPKQIQPDSPSHRKNLTSTQFLSRLIQLQPSLLLQSFDFAKEKARVQTLDASLPILSKGV